MSMSPHLSLFSCEALTFAQIHPTLATRGMGELDAAWELALAEAKRRAHAAGRADIAQYLALRAENDLLRRTAIDWLVDTLTAFAADANRRGAAIQIERTDAHNCRVGAATMVG